MNNPKTVYVRPLKNNLTLTIEEENSTFQWRVIKSDTKKTVKYCGIQFSTLEAAQQGYLERNQYANIRN